MPEVSYSRKDHSQPQPVRRLDDLLVAHRPSRLDNSGRPRLGNFLDAMAVTVARGEVHPSVDAGGITLQRLLNEAVALDEIAPVGGAEES